MRIREVDEVNGIYFSASVCFPVDDLVEVVASLGKAVDAGVDFKK